MLFFDKTYANICSVNTASLFQKPQRKTAVMNITQKNLFYTTNQGCSQGNLTVGHKKEKHLSHPCILLYTYPMLLKSTCIYLCFGAILNVFSYHFISS